MLKKYLFVARKCLFTVICMLGLTGCADLSYYMHSINGHYKIVSQTRDIDELLQDESTEEELAERLQLVQRIRTFAFEELHLPKSDSYSIYADLKRSYVLKNLFATPEFSTAAHQWCYPIVGCAGYRGYFDEQRLQRYVQQLQQRNYDIYIAKVPAYSTLGWFDDPVLNTFIHWPEYRLAGLIFHELSHQRLFIDGDSHFNESFAVAVQQLGVEHWLRSHGQHDRLQRYRQLLENRRQVIELIESAKNELTELYQQALADDEMRQRKQQLLDDLRQRYNELSAQFSVADGFKRWFASELNNAKLLSVSTYHAQVPAFRSLFARLNNDFETFFQQVEVISELPAEQRNACIEALATNMDDASPAPSKASLSTMPPSCPPATTNQTAGH